MVRSKLIEAPGNGGCEMHVVLGLHLDGKHSWKKRNAINRFLLGPSGLLSQLELYLGLSARRPAELQRVIVFRSILKRVDNGQRFYSRSMKVDEIGVAAELLGWRDELYLHGWNGRFREKPGKGRLADFADVEAAVLEEGFPPGNGERLAAVADALQSLRTPVTSLELLEPLERHPPRWQEVVRMFPYSISNTFERPNAGQGTAPHALQHRLLFPGSGVEQPDIDADGTIAIFTADTPLAAAYRTGRELLLKQGDKLLVETGEGALLDDVLEAQGLPGQAVKREKAGKPFLQLLPHALRLLKRPLDVDALFSFLKLPQELNPLDHVLSERLARVIAVRPGIGSRQWEETLRDYRHSKGKKTASAVEDLEQWVESGKSWHDEPTPLHEVAACAERVKLFFSRKTENKKEDELSKVFSAGFEHASAVLEAVNALVSQGERQVGMYQTDQLLELAEGVVGNFEQREAGSMPDTAHPGAVCEAFSHVVWWWAASPQMEQGVPWSAGERLFLEKEGVGFPSPEKMLQRQADDWLRPILAARDSFTLFLPPEGEERHPVWFEIASIASSVPAVQVEGALCYDEAKSEKIPGRELPGKKPCWRLPEGVSMPGRPFSPTSLETFINAPSVWFLEHVAKIGMKSDFAMSDGPMLYGTLAHRLVQELANRLQEGMDTVSHLDDWFDPFFYKLVQTEGAVLLMPGRGTELENMRLRIRLAVDRLLTLLKEQGSGSIHAEQPLQGSLPGYVMKGRADLLLVDRNGEPSVIDLKWGSADRYMKSLRQGTHIQLLAYAAMVVENGEKCWPALAYYIMKNSRILASRNVFFAFGEALRTEDDEPSEALWLRVLESFSWRMDQIEQGIVSVGGAEKEDNLPDLSPPSSGIAPSAVDDPYNPYRFLEGWEEHR